MGAMATITLPVTSNADPGSLHSAATLQLHTVNGEHSTSLSERHKIGKAGHLASDRVRSILFVAAHEFFWPIVLKKSVLAPVDVG
jgi:hypothetical protein